MAAAKVILFLVQFTLYCIYLVFWFIWEGSKKLWWMVNGTHATLKQTNTQEGYEMSAHVLDIWWRFRFQFSQTTFTFCDFITVHNRFDHPNVVLGDNVILHGLTKNHAIFVETEKNVDLTNCKLHNLLYNDAYLRAKRIIVLPMYAFYHLAEDLGPIETNLVFISNTMRCGSTLLCQIFQATGRCIVLSEPQSLHDTCQVVKDMNEVDAEKLLCSTVRMLCKPHCTKPSVYVFKLTGLTMKQVPSLHKLYPEAKHLFIYREALPFLQSFFRALQIEDNLIWFLISIVPYIGATAAVTKKLCEEMNVPIISTPIKYSTSAAFVGWAAICRMYMEARKGGVPIAGLKYEHLLHSPETFMRIMLKHCELSHLWSPKCMDVLLEDSQKYTFLSRAKLRKFKSPDFTQEMLENMEAVASELGVPPPSEPAFLEGTITSDKN